MATSASFTKAKLSRRVRVLEQFCERLGRQLANVQVTLRQSRAVGGHGAPGLGSGGGSGVGSGGGGGPHADSPRHGKKPRKGTGVPSFPVDAATAATASTQSAGLSPAAATTVLPSSPAHLSLSAVVSAGARRSAHGHQEVVATRLTPVVAEALAGDVRRQVLQSVDRRFVELEGLKDVGFQDVWRELRGLHSTLQADKGAAALAQKEFELALKGELLGSTKETENQLDAIQVGVSTAIQQHVDATAAVVATTHTRISEVEDDMRADIAKLRGGDGSDVAGFADASAKLAALRSQVMDQRSGLAAHIATTRDAFHATQAGQSQLTDALASTTTTADAASAAVAALEERLAQATARLEATQARAHEQQQALVEQVEDLRKRLATQEERTQQMHEQLEAVVPRHTAQLGELAQAAQASSQALAQLSQRVAAHGLELGRVGEHTNRVDAGLQQLQADHHETLERLGHVKAQVELLTGQLTAAARRAKENTATCTSLMRRVTAQTNSVESLRSEVATAMSRRVPTASTYASTGAATAAPAAAATSTTGDAGRGGDVPSSSSPREATRGSDVTTASQLGRKLAALRQHVKDVETSLRARLDGVDADTRATLERHRAAVMSHVDEALQAWSDAHPRVLRAVARRGETADAPTLPQPTTRGASAATRAGPGTGSGAGSDAGAGAGAGASAGVGPVQAPHPRAGTGSGSTAARNGGSGGAAAGDGGGGGSGGGSSAKAGARGNGGIKALPSGGNGEGRGVPTTDSPGGAGPRTHAHTHPHTRSDSDRARSRTGAATRTQATAGAGADANASASADTSGAGAGGGVAGKQATTPAPVSTPSRHPSSLDSHGRRHTRSSSRGVGDSEGEGEGGDDGARSGSRPANVSNASGAGSSASAFAPHSRRRRRRRSSDTSGTDNESTGTGRSSRAASATAAGRDNQSTGSGTGASDGNPIGRSPRVRKLVMHPALAPSIVSGTESSIVGRDALPPNERNLVIPSPLPDITIERTSLTSFLLRRAMDYGDKIAFMSAPDSSSSSYSPEQTPRNAGFTDLGALDDWLTYRDFSTQVRLLGAGLARKKFQKSDVMCIYAPNHVRYAVAFHAGVALGGVVAPCPVTESNQSLSELFILARPRVVVTTSAYLAFTRAALKRCNRRADIVLLDGTSDDDADGLFTLDTLMSGGVAGFPAHMRVSPSRDPVVLLYVPRGSDKPDDPPRAVFITHKNIVATLKSCLTAITSESVTTVADVTGTRVYSNAAVFQKKDLVVCGTSFATAAGLVWGLHLPFMMGASVVCVGPVPAGRNSTDAIGAIVQRCKAGVLVLSQPEPALVMSLWHVLRQVIVAVPLVNAMHNASELHTIPPDGVSVCTITGPYEMLCCSHIMHMTHSLRQQPAETLARVVGVPLPSVRCRLVEAHNRAHLAPDTPTAGRHGRLCLRSQAVARGVVTRTGVRSLSLDAYRFFHAHTDLAVTSSGLFMMPPPRSRSRRRSDPALPTVVVDVGEGDERHGTQHRSRHSHGQGHGHSNSHLAALGAGGTDDAGGSVSRARNDRKPVDTTSHPNRGAAPSRHADTEPPVHAAATASTANPNPRARASYDHHEYSHRHHHEAALPAYASRAPPHSHGSGASGGHEPRHRRHHRALSNSSDASPTTSADPPPSADVAHASPGAVHSQERPVPVRQINLFPAPASAGRFRR